MKLSIGFIFASSLCIADFASANGNDAGVMASNGCVNCHGVEGRGTATGNVPSLIGRSKEFLAAAMQGYKRGTLQGTVMNRVMKDFDEEKISFLADYFSGIK
jgi:cytochrome c553